MRLDSGLIGARSLDTYAVLDKMLVSLAKSILNNGCLNWLISVVVANSFLRVPKELIICWSEIKMFFRESGVSPVVRCRSPVDIGQLIVSDASVLTSV